jgi:glutathione S-transferase
MTNWRKCRGSLASSSALAILPSPLRLQPVVDPRHLATAPHLQRWYQQISQRPAWREVVQIPVT